MNTGGNFLFIALVLCPVMPTFAHQISEGDLCTVCPHTTNVGKPNDPAKGACQELPQFGAYGDSTPFAGDNANTTPGPRYAGPTNCGDCTFTAYLSAPGKGMGTDIDGNKSHTSLGPCGKSPKLDCGIIVAT